MKPITKKDVAEQPSAEALEAAKEIWRVHLNEDLLDEMLRRLQHFPNRLAELNEIAAIISRAIQAVGEPYQRAVSEAIQHAGKLAGKAAEDGAVVGRFTLIELIDAAVEKERKKAEGLATAAADLHDGVNVFVAGTALCAACGKPKCQPGCPVRVLSEALTTYREQTDERK